jgi:hypothetical protein
MRGFLLISVLMMACGPGGGGSPDAGGDGDGDGKELLRYALEAVEAPASAPVATDVGVVATVTATPTGLRVLPGAQATTEPAAGVLVNFKVVTGGGEVYAGAALTNSLGQAREIWTLGTAAGDQVLEARAVDPNTGAPVVYATATTRGEPGSPVRYYVGFTNVPPGESIAEFQANVPFDLIGTTRMNGSDQYYNDVQVEQTQRLVGIALQGSVRNGPAPACTIEGALVTCPPSTSANYSPTCTDHCWNVMYEAVLEVPNGDRWRPQFLVR